MPDAPPPVGPDDSGVHGIKDKGVQMPEDAAPPGDTGVPPDPPDTGLPVDTGILPDAGTMVPDTGPVMDSDNDGIPDDEDPNPGYTNPILLTDHFTDESGGWIFSSVSMEIASSESVLRVPVIEPFEREGWVGPRPNWSDYFVRSVFRINAVGSSTERDAGYVAVMGRVNQVTPSRYVSCGLDLKNQRVLLAEYEGTSRTILAQTAAPFSVNEWLLINFFADGAFYRCDVGGIEASASSAVFFSGSVGFRSFDATFESDWIEVYELQL